MRHSKIFAALASILLILCVMTVAGFLPSRAFAASNTAAKQIHAVQPLACPPTIGEGNAGPWVKTLQNQLNTLFGFGEFPNSPFNFSPPLHVDGIFGSLTRNAVMDFQKASHLQVDGVVGPQTWHVLAWC